MNRYIVALFTAVVGAVATNPVAAEPNWDTYRFPDKGFAIDLPAAPAVKIDEGDPPSEKIQIYPTVTYYSVDLGARGVILVSYLDNSAILGGMLLYPEKVIDGTIFHMAKKGQFTVTWRRKITVEGHSGRDYTARSKTGEFLVKSRIVLVGFRLYQVFGLGPVAQGVPAEYQCAAASLTFKTDTPPRAPCAHRG